ncbi:WG repeat-containing protein [Hymenobacter monticola]|uniref:WG repeat-containing protein n=1 Tax=Hymenobacter monticola TaxID=1705399 RepID=A0ABY4BCC2_9BACT|nr:WG repeat-containing protein [Hymenobacter monticola]UOE36801.1 WG repeat-containing protein [Hymenobacter monticola]
MCRPRPFALFVLPVPGWLLVLLLLASATTGQAQVPPGGYIPRPVKHLARVPEPPGGLVPYRKGKLWGYSDTTGRLVVKPVFEREPWPFALGFGTVSPKPLTLINARGELIRASRRRAIGFAPKGGFALVSRRGVGFRPAVSGLRYPRDGRVAVIDTQWLSPRNRGDGRLSPTRGARRKHSSLPGKFLALYDEYEREALTNEHGRRLTDYKYTYITPFHEGFAVATRTGGRTTVLLNRQGREITRGSASASPVFHNRALRSPYAEPTQLDLIDSTGQVLQTFGTTGGAAGWFVDGEVFSARSPYKQGLFRFYDRNGQVLLGGQEFRRSDRPWNNRRWMQFPDGKEGLMNRQLQWVAPPEYEALYYPLINGSRVHTLDIYQIRDFPHDTAYLVARRDNRYGQLAVASGQLVIPARYDTIVSPLTLGFAVAQRGGQSYVVNRRGQEISPGSIPRSSYPDCRDGVCRVGIVRGDQVALFDETGQQLCPWQAIVPNPAHLQFQYMPQAGYDGLVVIYRNPALVEGASREGSPSANLITRDGRPQLPWRYEYISAWNGFYALRLCQKPGSTGSKWEVYDRQLRPLLAHPVDNLNDFPGGWLSTGTEMFHASGRRIAVPDATRQRFQAVSELLPMEPFANDIWPVYDYGNRTGYLTIHGRALWENE